MINTCRIEQSVEHPQHPWSHEFFHRLHIHASIKAVKHQRLHLKHVLHRNFRGCWKAPCEHQCKTFALLQVIFHTGNIHCHPQGMMFSLHSVLGLGELLLFTVEHTAQPFTNHPLLISEVPEWHSKLCPAVSFIHVLASCAKP